MSSRDKILARRTKFIAAAVCGLSVASCGSQAEVCLSIAAEDSGDGDASKDASADTRDTGLPEACLSPPYDSGPGDTTVGDTTTIDSADDTAITDAEKDTGPMPCLAPPPS